MRVAVNMIYPGAQFLSLCGPVKLKKVLCSQNIVVHRHGKPATDIWFKRSHQS